VDQNRFDTLARSFVVARSRRGALGLAAAGLAAGLGLPVVADAKGGPGAEKKKKKKNKRCRKENQTCGGKQTCCKNQNLTCENGTCVQPPQAECSVDDDCDFNETCEGGTCSCDLRVNGTCVRQCDNGGDCPGPAGCRNHFPASSGAGVVDGVCVDESGLLCDTDSCQFGGDNACASGEICVQLGCGAFGEVTFRCLPIAVGNDFEN
jgi:hypothetical protein